ncbi:hypothetical protein GCM10022419_132670 [Nonomuraea rosea]|uniref:Site-specific integrase n=1 Tax=Nonomuraea rosea TaxID=638574 RepID=A0ABP7A460_9ACTN
MGEAPTKLLLHTGTCIDAVTAEDIFELRSWGIARQVHVPGLHGAWKVAAKIGATSGEQTLRGALRAGPRPTEELVDRYGLEHRHIRDLLVGYLNERRPALDYSSFLTLVGVLAGAFWGDIERHHPEQDSIHLPDDVVQAWKERLASWTDWSTGKSRPRSVSDQVGIKVKVRGFYLDIQKWAPEDPRWVAWVVPCPIRKSEVAGLAKLKRASSAQMHQRIRDRLPRLGELVDAAESARAEQQRLLAAALAASAGACFEHDGRAYQRFVPEVHTIGPSVRKPGLPDVMARDVESGERLNLSVSEENAFWAWAIIEILRHTGIRLEELLELTHLALVSYQLTGTDEVVPLLQIVLSKTGAERLLLVPPELASVLAQVITKAQSGQSQAGSDPGLSSGASPVSQSSSVRWSCGSKRRWADKRGGLHQLPEDRARHRPHHLLPGLGGVAVLVLQMEEPHRPGRAHRPPAPAGRPGCADHLLVRESRRHLRFAADHP